MNQNPKPRSFNDLSDRQMKAILKLAYGYSPKGMSFEGMASKDIIEFGDETNKLSLHSNGELRAWKLTDGQQEPTSIDFEKVNQYIQSLNLLFPKSNG